jgi:NAD(P)-dependent dehydrogenase (short-subunit alcohol dehydrogenase family)
MLLKQLSRPANLRLSTQAFCRRASTIVDKAPINAIVTGGASGIGEAVCSKLASRGINVLIADLQVGRGNALARRLSRTYSVDVHYTPLDVSLEQSVQEMVQCAVQRWGRVDYAANCAGICESTWAEEESITTELVDKWAYLDDPGCYRVVTDIGKQDVRNQSTRTLALSKA